MEREHQNIQAIRQLYEPFGEEENDEQNITPAPVPPQERVKRSDPAPGSQSPENKQNTETAPLLVNNPDTLGKYVSVQINPQLIESKRLFVFLVPRHKLQAPGRKNIDPSRAFGVGIFENNISVQPIPSPQETKEKRPLTVYVFRCRKPQAPGKRAA